MASGGWPLKACADNIATRPTASTKISGSTSSGGARWKVDGTRGRVGRVKHGAAYGECGRGSDAGLIRVAVGKLCAPHALRGGCHPSWFRGGSAGRPPLHLVTPGTFVLAVLLMRAGQHSGFQQAGPGSGLAAEPQRHHVRYPRPSLLQHWPPPRWQSVSLAVQSSGWFAPMNGPAQSDFRGMHRHSPLGVRGCYCCSWQR